MQALSSRHLLGIEHLTKSDLELIYHTAAEFRGVLERPIRKVPSLRDVTIANLFFENSTRTRISFELAARRLSADVLNFTASSSSVSKGETLLDTVNNILAMKVDVVVIRHSKVGAPHFLSQRVSAQIVNAGDGAHEHPTQGLLDSFSLLRQFGILQGLKVAIIGDIRHSRVALSNIFALKKMGAEVMLCGPPTLIPPHFKALGVHITYSLEQALQWADAINVLRIQLERQNIKYFPSLHEYNLTYGITMEKLERLSKMPVILHPGPINRGVEISSEVADSPSAIILDQVLNGVAVRMAVLYLLVQSKN